jgi:hypothetical protein
VLGIEPAEPGFAVARVQPNLGDLQWAHGAAPTPYGLIRVHATPHELSVRSPIPFIHDGRRHEAGEVALTLAPV